MHFLAEYGLFLAKVVTFVAAILIVFLGIVAIAAKGKPRSKERLEVKNINEKYHSLKDTFNQKILNKDEYKHFQKAEKKSDKAQHAASASRKKVFLINFHGDIKATAVKQLREEITAILLVAKPEDEVFVCLESHGGLVHAYGLAASQLQRIRQRKIPLTISIDKIAASGGYLMACVADQIIAAPFAIIGSIGVVAQIPNFHRLLKKNDIDYELVMAGEYKRTLTIFGKNTEKGRKKFQEEVEEIHNLFKQFIQENRPIVNVDQVATGEHWCASQALELKLVDKLSTSDDYLLDSSKNADIFKVCFVPKKSFTEKLSASAQLGLNKLMESWKQQNQETRFL